MATLPRVLFFVTKHKQQIEPIPQTVVMKDGGTVFDSQIIVDEYNRVLVHLESDDPSALLSIEVFDDQEPIVVKPGETKNLMKGGQTPDMLVPGQYPFTVITNTNRYEAYFTIRVQTISSEGLINLRSYVEQFLSGLSFDLSKKRSGMFENLAQLPPAELQVFNLLQERFKEIRYLLELISKSPIYDVVKVYEEQYGTRKPDAKSFRWLAKKGGNKNPNLFQPSIMYEGRSVLSVNNLENQWMAYILKYVLRALRRLDGFLTESVCTVTNQIDHAKREEENVRLSLSKIPQYNKDNYNKVAKSIDTRLEKLLGDQRRLKGEREALETIKKEVRKMMNVFSTYEEQQWVQQQVPLKSRKQSIRLYKDRRYREVLQFYKDLTQIEKRSLSHKDRVVPYKSTWLLFEYYSLILVIKLLKDLGYQWTKGWIADNTQATIGHLQSGTVLTFEKGDYFIEIAYDKDILPSDLVSYNESEYMGNKPCRPDLRLTIFHKNGDILEQEAGLIIEVKCRNRKNIKDDRVALSSNVMAQLDVYRSLLYYDAEKQKTIYPVKEVITLYPKQEGSITSRDRRLRFIQIEPTEPNEKPYGYDDLKERIENYLSQILVKEGVMSADG